MEPVDVRDLLERPGTSRRLRLLEPVPGMRTELASVADEEPVVMELLLEGVVEGVYVTGPVAGTWRLSCARCLRPLEQDFRVEVSELFARDPDEEADEYAVGDARIDLEPMVRDAVVLAMPFSPLCRPDCLGLCERCGGDRNLGECSCGPRTDPRWAALDQLNLD